MAKEEPLRDHEHDRGIWKGTRFPEQIWSRVHVPVCRPEALHDFIRHLISLPYAAVDFQHEVVVVFLCFM